MDGETILNNKTVKITLDTISKIHNNITTISPILTAKFIKN